MSDDFRRLKGRREGRGEVPREAEFGVEGAGVGGFYKILSCVARMLGDVAHFDG
jgi:hypothetical protein